MLHVVYTSFVCPAVLQCFCKGEFLVFSKKFRLGFRVTGSGDDLLYQPFIKFCVGELASQCLLSDACVELVDRCVIL